MTLQDVRQFKRQQIATEITIKNKVNEKFDHDPMRLIEQKSKVLRGVVDKVTFFRNIEMFRVD